MSTQTTTPQDLSHALRDHLPSNTHITASDDSWTAVWTNPAGVYILEHPNQGKIEFHGPGSCIHWDTTTPPATVLATLRLHGALPALPDLTQWQTEQLMAERDQYKQWNNQARLMAAGYHGGLMGMRLALHMLIHTHGDAVPSRHLRGLTFDADAAPQLPWTSEEDAEGATVTVETPHAGRIAVSATHPYAELTAKQAQQAAAALLAAAIELDMAPPVVPTPPTTAEGDRFCTGCGVEYAAGSRHTETCPVLNGQPYTSLLHPHGGIDAKDEPVPGPTDAELDATFDQVVSAEQAAVAEDPERR